MVFRFLFALSAALLSSISIGGGEGAFFFVGSVDLGKVVRGLSKVGGRSLFRGFDAAVSSSFGGIEAF